MRQRIFTRRKNADATSCVTIRDASTVVEMKWWIWVVAVAALSACGSVKGGNKPNPDAGTGGSSPCVLDQSKIDNCKL